MVSLIPRSHSDFAVPRLPSIAFHFCQMINYNTLHGVAALLHQIRTGLLLGALGCQGINILTLKKNLDSQGLYFVLEEHVIKCNTIPLFFVKSFFTLPQFANFTSLHFIQQWGKSIEKIYDIRRRFMINGYCLISFHPTGENLLSR